MTEWTLAESLATAERVGEVLDSLGVRYVVGGSVASSLHGHPRSTMDVDLVADIRLGHVDRFVEALKDSFYVSPDMIRTAISSFDSFNVIELKTMLKVDVFVTRNDRAADEELSRGIEVVTADGHRLRVASAEDIVVEKLRWWRLGGEVSDRQWRDAVGVLEVQGDRLDRVYMRRRADSLGLADALARAEQDANAS